MKKQVWYEDQKSNQISQKNLEHPPHMPKTNANLNNAVQLLLQNKFAQSHNKPKIMKNNIAPTNKFTTNANKQFFNPNPGHTITRPTGPKSKSQVEEKIAPPKFLPQLHVSNASKDQQSSLHELSPPKVKVEVGVDRVPNKSIHIKRKSSKNVQAQTQEFLRYSTESKYLNSTRGDKIPPVLVSVHEAAAKLSFPWPPPSIYEPGRKNQANSNDSGLNAEELSQKKTRLLEEIHEFFESHQDLLTLPGVKTALEKTKNVTMNYSQEKNQKKLDESLDAVMESLKLVFLQNGLPANFRRSDDYKPVTAPDFEEVETSWPGFESKPVPNWTDFAVPSKIMLKKKQMQKQGGEEGKNGTNKSWAAYRRASSRSRERALPN